MSLSEEDVREILAVIDAEGPTEVRVETRGWSIHVVRGAAGEAEGASASAERRPSASGSGPERSADAVALPASEASLLDDDDDALVVPEVGAPVAGEDGGSAGHSATEPEAEERPEGPPGSAATTATTTIDSPMLGVFYLAEAPGKPAFVSVGDRVEPDTVVGIVEVMKMMNSVEAGVSGTVAEVVVSNAEMVEEGQALFRVDPS